MNNEPSTSKKEIFEALAVNVFLGIVFFITEKILPDSGVRYLFLALTGIATLTILFFPRFKRAYQETLTKRLQVQQPTIIQSPPLNTDDRESFHTRAWCHHQLVHHARDTALRLMPPVAPYDPPAVAQGKKAQPLKSLGENHVVIQGMLQQMVTIFSDLVPAGTRVWTCMRDRRADDCYHTFERAGRFNMRRVDGTKHMHKDRSMTVRNLKLSYDNGSCVIITGSTRGPTEWQPSSNDELGEDKCVLMGAVMTRSVDGDGNWNNRKLAWILCVNADREDVFTTQHVPLMQCFVDTFSWLANTMIRSEAEWNPTANKPLHPTADNAAV